ncbi:alpha/beta fold hydrolase [Micromonospora antibiotica]|uniref:Alpha/beta fold hydrolase n=1 Tax=Micromonospora antibiotica TaxID=2807623 RepID=A0ABS3VGH5_9ACTN|nr:alpha/beta fold hydrolase [Micromonospora antibiotica]MBO4164654.1 alpha/beta fold hydrolase [Micromonospora antibiotica]
MGKIEFAKLPGLRMAYRSWGPPAGRPLVALHGGSTDGLIWAGLAAALGDTARLYAPDLPGYGSTDHTGRYALTALRDDVRALLDALALTRVTLVGHSLGAVLAYQFAHAYPDRVAALVLTEPPPPVPLGFRLPPRPAEPQPFDWAVRETVVAELNDPDPAWWDRLAQLTAATLVVAGGPTSHLPQDQLARMAARLPAGELLTIDAGHAPHIHRPAEFHAAVRAFLDRTLG